MAVRSSQGAAEAQNPAHTGGWVIVTGATGGVGKRVIARLLRQGKKIRAVVRDAGKATAMLVHPSLSGRSCVFRCNLDVQLFISRLGLGVAKN